jgi:tyrosine-specific transport protein
MACLIAGNLLGAGILGLPINTGLSGVLPSLLAMMIYCGAMYFSAVVLAREAVAQQREDFNYPSLYREHLGAAGKWVAILANLLILYGLLTAYLTGAASIVVHQLYVSVPGPAALLGIFLVLSGLTLLNVGFIQKYNTVLILVLGISFVCLVMLAAARMQPSRLAYMDWRYLPAAVPIVLTSFHFHNIIPTICFRLDWDERAVRRTMAMGMLLGFLMNIIWVAVGVGAVPLAAGSNSLRFAFLHSLPVTVLLEHEIHTRMFTICAMSFALIAIVTSFIANGLGLLGFLEDFTDNFLKRKSRLLVAALAFGPPGLVALFFPGIFLKAIDLVGGVGIAVLFGILPAVIALRMRKPGLIRRLAWPMLVLFLLALGFEVMQETGISHVKPEAVRNAEYWKHNLEKHPAQKNTNREGRP